jgi:hypothetical protein
MSAKVHRLDEFQPLIQRLEAAGVSYTLIGGLGVAHYGEHYLSNAQKHTHQFPIYSKDIDFCGGTDLYDAIQREAPAVGMQIVGGMGTIRPKPGMNRVPGHVLALLIDGESTSVEIMERLPLHNLDLTELTVTGSALSVSGVVVLDPCTLLLTKLAAFHERPQGDLNNDAAHCSILVDVIPAFLKDAVSRLRAGQTDYDPATDCWRLLRVLERANHPLPGDAHVCAAFIKWLHVFTIDWLIQTGQLAPETAS